MEKTEENIQTADWVEQRHIYLNVTIASEIRDELNEDIDDGTLGKTRFKIWYILYWRYSYLHEGRHHFQNLGEATVCDLEDFSFITYGYFGNLEQVYLTLLWFFLWKIMTSNPLWMLSGSTHASDMVWGVHAHRLMSLAKNRIFFISRFSKEMSCIRTRGSSGVREGSLN